MFNFFVKKSSKKETKINDVKGRLCFCFYLLNCRKRGMMPKSTFSRSVLDSAPHKKPLASQCGLTPHFFFQTTISPARHLRWYEGDDNYQTWRPAVIQTYYGLPRGNSDTVIRAGPLIIVVEALAAGHC